MVSLVVCWRLRPASELAMQVYLPESPAFTSITISDWLLLIQQKENQVVILIDIPVEDRIPGLALLGLPGEHRPVLEPLQLLVARAHTAVELLTLKALDPKYVPQRHL